MYIDFRNLNVLTVDNSYPLPRLDLLLHRAGASQYFSKIDLTSGFHQIALSRTTRELTAFRLPEPVERKYTLGIGSYAIQVEERSSYLSESNDLSYRGSEDFAVVYMDDVLIFSPDRKSYLKHLNSVFYQLDLYSYYIRLLKCKFMKREVEFLGHQLSSMVYVSAPAKVAALQAWKLPLQRSKQVKQFLSLVI